jgi:hypothetical protein
MEIILELLRDLWSTLTVSDFLKTVGIVVFLTFVLVNFLLKRSRGKAGLITIFRGTSREGADMKEIKDKLAAFVVSHTDSMARLLIAVNLINTSSADSAKTQAISYAQLKIDIEETRDSLVHELDDVRHLFKMNDLSASQSVQVLKDLLQRVLDVLARMNSELEKVDEFVRGMVPEFRNDNRELGRDISDLSKDIALIERTLQTQINSSKGVKLR